MRNITRFLLASLLLLGLPNADAESFAELLDLLDQHPRLEALRRESSAHASLADAALGLPDPVVSLGINNLPVQDPAFDRYLPTNKAIGLEQRIPSRAGRQALRATEAATALLLTRQAAAVHANLVGELQVLLHQRSALEQEQQLTREQTMHYQALKQTVRADVSSGKPLVYRLSELDAEAAEVALRQADLTAELGRVDGELVALLNRVPDTPPPRVSPPAWDGDPQRLHAVQIAAAGEAAAAGAQRRAATRWRPEWGLSLAYQQREPGQGFDGDDWLSARISFTVPLWAGRSQQPRLDAATKEREAARADVTAATRAATATLHALKANYRRALTSEQTLQQQLEAVRETISAQRRLYESGSGSYGPVLDGEIIALRLEAGAVRQTAAAATAAARFNARLISE